MCFEASPPPASAYLRSEEIAAQLDELRERLPKDEPALPTLVPEITAVVHDATIIDNRLVGTSYDHARFANGEVIRTSPIVATFLVHVTRSGSYYLVEDTRANPEASPAFASGGRIEKRQFPDGKLGAGGSY